MPRPTANPSDNRLLTGPLNRLIREIAVPVSMGFFFNLMFNVVDTFWAGRLSTQAMAALSLAFPVFFIIAAVGSGLGTGATALIASALGAGDPARARLFQRQSLYCGLLASGLLTGLGLWLAPWLFTWLGAGGDYLAVCLEYMNPIFATSLFFVLVLVMNASLTAAGRTKPFRDFLLVGFFLNLVLDPWFIYGGCGLPAMGVAGVAWATVLVHVLGCFYLGRELVKAGVLTLEAPASWRPQPRALGEIARQGLPSTFGYLTTALGSFLITYFYGQYGQAAVAAYGIGTRVEQIAILPTLGLNTATLALVAQNHGAGLVERCRETYRRALAQGAALSALGTPVVFFLAPWFMGLFTSDPEVVAIGAAYLKVVAFLIFAYVAIYASVAVLQGLKRPGFGFWMGLLRQFVAPLPVLYLASLTWGVAGLWWGVLAVNGLAAVVAFLYARRALARLAPAGGEA